MPTLGGPAVVTPTLSTPPHQPLPASVTAVTGPFAAAAANSNPQTLIPVTMTSSGMPLMPGAAVSLLTPLRPGTPGLGLPVMPPPIMTTSAGKCCIFLSPCVLVPLHKNKTALHDQFPLCRKQNIWIVMFEQFCSLDCIFEVHTYLNWNTRNTFG